MSTRAGQSLDAATNILPESSARTLQNSIRLGKLNSENQLVGGYDGESEEEDGTVQEVLELLKKGEVYNAGPDSSGPHFVPPAQSLPALKPLATKPGASKFKLARAQAGRPPTTVEPHSSQETPQKLLSSQVQNVVEAPSFPNSNSMASAPFSTIVESPSYTSEAYEQRPSRRLERPPTVVSSTVRESGLGNNSTETPQSGTTPAKKISRFMADRM